MYTTKVKGRDGPVNFSTVPGGGGGGGLGSVVAMDKRTTIQNLILTLDQMIELIIFVIYKSIFCT